MATENQTRDNGYWKGQTDAEIRALGEAIERVETSLNEHRKEEKETWEKFSQQLQGVVLWRARVVGYAAGASAVVSLVWNVALRFWK